MGRVFANSLEDWHSISGQVITKPQKMVPDATLLNTQHYKVKIKSKEEQEKGLALPTTLWFFANEKATFRSPLTTVTNFTFYYIYIYIYNKRIIIPK